MIIFVNFCKFKNNILANKNSCYNYTGDNMNKTYICIDLKSFYASVECVRRGLDPLTTNLVVADLSRTEKTICLAVSPSLKQYGIKGRARLFEVIETVKKINYERKKKACNYKFTKKSFNDIELKNDKNLELDYIVATPKMSDYIKCSTEIYKIYLKYIDKDDIHVYSIDEVFCDITSYLKYYNLTKEELVTKIIKDIYDKTKVTATCGIGTNMYLAKVAMDIVAKHSKPNSFGVRIAYLDENLYRKLLWNHEPLTDFWRIGEGYEKKLQSNNIYTMGDIARTSINNEKLLYKLFGVNAEFLIDHAWGYEPCTMKDIKKYKPKTNSISTGQVLHCSYNKTQARIIVKEMIDNICLELTLKSLVTNKLVVVIGFDINNYSREYKIDHYGRKIPKPKTINVKLDHKTSSPDVIRKKVIEEYDRVLDNTLLIKRINIVLITFDKEKIKNEKRIEQIDLFSNIEEKNKEILKEIEKEKTDSKLQKILINIKNKYGKNSILKGMDLEECATARDRNNQIGGHNK